MHHPAGMTRTQILVINCGSSSLKFALLDNNQETPLASGIAECLDTPQASIRVTSSVTKDSIILEKGDHQDALATAIEVLRAHGVMHQEPDIIGHRVAHGGEFFADPVRVTAEVIDQIEQCNHLAPLHNPSAVLGLRMATKLFPKTPQVAVFDTAFHQTIPEHAYLYALPLDYYQKHGVRRYGFHGSSHGYVSQKAAQQLDFNLQKSRIITAHLGNGCSTAAILNGHSVDTSMGMTPLEGLVMGTRCGDIDPGLIIFLSDQLDMTTEQISDLLNKKSGLLGISGQSNDMRTLRQLAADGCQRSSLAIEVFCYRIAKSIASLTVASGGIDYLIFTGGIGENDTMTRSRVLEHLAFLGLIIDPQNNAVHGRHSAGVITASASKVTAAVIATNEELMIAQLANKTISDI